jgi:hypothetical protein
VILSHPHPDDFAGLGVISSSLLGEQGRRAEARDLLAPVYGWFAERFDTGDLKETKALLGELARAGDWHVPKSGTNVRSLAGPTIHGRGTGMALKVDCRPSSFSK